MFVKGGEKETRKFFLALSVRSPKSVFVHFVLFCAPYVGHYREGDDHGVFRYLFMADLML